LGLASQKGNQPFRGRLGGFIDFMQAPLPIDPEIPGGGTSALHHYEDDHIREVIDLLGTVASSFTPMISIVVLAFVSSPHVRLGLVCCFTVLFALSLALATRARRIEIFGATAA